MSRTIGAAIGAVLFVLFMSMLATNLARPASAASQLRAGSVTVQP